MLASFFAVPVRSLPAELPSVAPGGVRQARLAGRALVAVVFADYRPGGDLSYSELLVAVIDVGVGLVTIPAIWVDSEASRRGARALWSIPKELGVFERHVAGDLVRVEMSAADRRVAGLEARIGSHPLPLRPRIPLRTAQLLGGTSSITSSVLRGRLRRLSTRWRFAQHGPLGYLSDHRPFLSAALTDAAITFGTKAIRSAPAEGGSARISGA